jgi:hypothetical protein
MMPISDVWILIAVILSVFTGVSTVAVWILGRQKSEYTPPPSEEVPASAEESQPASESLTDLEETVVDRLKEENIEELAKKNTTYYYDVLSDNGYMVRVCNTGDEDILAFDVYPIPRGVALAKSPKPKKKAKEVPAPVELSLNEALDKWRELWPEKFQPKIEVTLDFAMKEFQALLDRHTAEMKCTQTISKPSVTKWFKKQKLYVRNDKSSGRSITYVLICPID